MKLVSRFLTAVSLGLVLFAALATPAAAIEYTVTVNPYTVSHTLLNTENWNAYELIAEPGGQVSYTLTVTSAGDCAMLLMVRGHNPTGSSQYDTRYSMDTCGLSYANTYPVPSNLGNQFSIVIMTDRFNDIDYSLTITVTPPTPISPLLIGGIVIVVVVVIIAVVAAVMMKRKKAAAMPPPAMPPYMGPTQPGYPAPPPTYPQPPQQPPQYPPPPQGP